MTLGYDTRLSPSERRRLGVWYTPDALVEAVVSNTLGPVSPGTLVTVLDPACGDGRFLFAAASLIRAAGAVPVLTGVDIDMASLRAVGSLPEPVEMIEADALHHDFGARRFDVVIGNPPFLSQMASATSRVGRSRFGGGPYADAAADFLAMSVRLAAEGSGRVGLVLPVSLLTARDAAQIRREVASLASMHWFWWSPEPVFDADVRTCAVALGRCDQQHLGGIRRVLGPTFDEAMPHPSRISRDDEHWGWLIADSLGLPTVPPLRAAGTLADHGLVTANFRDQYYGLVGAVRDDLPDDAPPLITTGLIDPGQCHFGRRSTRFAKTTYSAPRVDRSMLVPFMQRWAARCLVPKVLVATQTHVIEAVVDVEGRWLPAVPVVRVVPTNPADVWRVAAVLTSPAASAVIASQSAGSGLSATTVRVSQRTLGMLPWPAGDLQRAVVALRAGDLDACARAVSAAYGADDDDVHSWWVRGLPRG